MKAQQILNDPFLNKGTAFTAEERAQFGLTGDVTTSRSNN